MFYHLEGKITELTPDSAAIDCNGIGFNVIITPNTTSKLSIGEKSKLYISESIGEDHFDLYGFSSLEEKKLFEMLISVSGIGPKAGMSILSYNNPSAIKSAIINSNESVFTACQGIGKKTAQRIILELKDKISKESGDSSVPVANVNFGNSDPNKQISDAVKALTALGYALPDINGIIKQIDASNMNSEQIVRTVLRYML